MAEARRPSFYLYRRGHRAFNNIGKAYGDKRFLEELMVQQDKSLEKSTGDTLLAMRKFGGKALPNDDVTLIGMEFTLRSQESSKEE